MCGIAGFVDFLKKTKEETLRSMACALSHRGPDGEGVYFKETEMAFVGFGHRRLSIIDLSSAANQPMHFDGLHLVFNGEIYNYAEIRNRLQQLGHAFQTHSDTEVILHAWKEWGEKSIDQWRGMFAIALYNEKEQELICIRDRAGVKPFYYYEKDGLFLFGSELKALIYHPPFSKEIDSDSLAAFLKFGNVPHPHCIFKSVAKLSPGHILRLSLKTKKIEVKPYWDVCDYYQKPKLTIDLAEAISATEKILTKSFQYRMVADVPVGVFLSGGYDSTCVTALLQQSSPDKIKTFTIGTTDKKTDEAPFAKKIASYLGTHHEEYYCTAKEALDIIPMLPYYYDEPFADSSALPTILVSRLARKKVTVALSADGGDEIFAGYNRYAYMLRYGRKIQALPLPIRRAAAAAMDAIPAANIPFYRNKPHFFSRYDKIKNLFRDLDAGEFLKSITAAFNNREIEALLSNVVTELPTLHHRTNGKAAGMTLLDQMMAADYQTYLVDDVLQKVDRATMSVSLEGREPFLDQHIIEWAAQLPPEYKHFQGEKKYILKKIVHKYVPKEMMERPKMGFSIPVQSWLANELKELVIENLSEASLKAHGLFNGLEVQKLVREFFNGRTEHHLKVWHLLMFQMWYKQWMT